jgi:probable rRNA maturation factor
MKMKIQIQIIYPEIKKTEPVLKKVTTWICRDLNLNIKSLAVIFISDKEIKELHKKFLARSTYTDIITFNLGEGDNIEGEIYISLDRAKIQAKTYQVALLNEIARLIIHGCLHLAGYDDHHYKNRMIMKQREDHYLERIQKLFLNFKEID